MSDSYQAIYDAVRSRISNGDVGRVVAEVAHRAFDISTYTVRLHEQFLCAAYEMQRPSVLYRPTVAPDGSKWHALYGPNQMEGVSGFGDTPSLAMEDFDRNWVAQRTPIAIMKCSRCDALIEPRTEPDGCRDPDCPSASDEATTFKPACGHVADGKTWP